MSDDRAQECTPEEWYAFWKIGQIREIASPGFAYRANLARELGLLDAILAGQEEEARQHALEWIAVLSAQIRWVYPTVQPHTATPAECPAHPKDQSESPSLSDTACQP